MPELPEIEHLRRTLQPVLIGRRVRRVSVRRRDVIRVDGRLRSADLLAGAEIGRLERHGKQLAIIGGTAGVAVCIHLGMSGQLRHLPPRRGSTGLTHVHCVWSLAAADGSPAGRLVFRDPRRFGGIWAFASETALRAGRWARLGPDALTVRWSDLARRLRRTGRPVKSALLDQGLVAGIGNIYADEALFTAGVHPLSTSRAVDEEAVRSLAGAIRATLRGAIGAGGSTLRDYVDAQGRDGGFRAAHRVYGRGGLACRRCGGALEQGVIAQRTTVWCSRCQRRHG